MLDLRCIAYCADVLHLGHLQDTLLAYLASAVPSFPSGTPLRIQQFKHGQSNPTYLIQARTSCSTRHRPPWLSCTNMLHGRKLML